MKKKVIKKSYQKMGLLEDFKMSLANFYFVMINIVHKMLLLLNLNL